MFFFWSVFDGIISYATPIFLVQKGLSNTFMGIILASSSIGGTLLDFVLVRLTKNTNFRKLFFVMFIASLIYPFILFTSKLIIFYILAMVVWGLYYDLANFGQYNFIGKRMRSNEHGDAFGVMSVFGTLGYMIAPILAGLIIVSVVSFNVFLFAFIFLLFFFLLFLSFLNFTKGKNKENSNNLNKDNFSLLKEIKILPTIALKIWPVLIFIMLLNISDSFFWTIGPLLSQSLKEGSLIGGFLLAAYGLPSLIVGWFVGKSTKKLGKKKTAMIAFFLGSLILMAIFFTDKPLLIVIIIFVSSFFSSLAWPAIKATFADYIYYSQVFETHIEGLADLSTNFGYIIGPILAGLISDKFGNRLGFGILGIFGAIFSLILMRLTPKKIRV